MSFPSFHELNKDEAIMKKYAISPQKGSLSLLGLLFALCIAGFLVIKAMDVYFPKTSPYQRSSSDNEKQPSGAARTDSTSIGPSPSVAHYGSVLTNVRGQLKSIKDRR
jgi:hypothetical protein